MIDVMSVDSDTTSGYFSSVGAHMFLMCECWFSNTILQAFRALLWMAKVLQTSGDGMIDVMSVDSDTTSGYFSSVGAHMFPMSECWFSNSHSFHWLHCHCSSCLFILLRLQGSVFNPVPIFWIMFYISGGMRYKVFTTRQCHILVTTHETCRH